jgi:hypothetical protein
VLVLKKIVAWDDSSKWKKANLVLFVLNFTPLNHSSTYPGGKTFFLNSIDHFVGIRRDSMLCCCGAAKLSPNFTSHNHCVAGNLFFELSRRFPNKACPQNTDTGPLLVGGPEDIGPVRTERAKTIFRLWALANMRSVKRNRLFTRLS